MVTPSSVMCRQRRRPRRRQLWTCHFVRSPLQRVTSCRSGEFTVRPDWSQQLDVLWKCRNCCSTSAYFGRIEAGWRHNLFFFFLFLFLKCFAANWAFVHLERQLVHNNVIVVKTVRTKAQLGSGMFHKVMSGNSCSKQG